MLLRVTSDLGLLFLSWDSWERWDLQEEGVGWWLSAAVNGPGAHLGLEVHVSCGRTHQAVISSCLCTHSGRLFC